MAKIYNDNHRKKKVWFKDREAGPYIGMSGPFQLRKWRLNEDEYGIVIPYYKFGRNVRYHISDLDAYIARHRVEGE